MHAVTIKQALRQAQHTFYGHESAQIDAELLLAHALGCSRTHLYTWPDQVLSPSQVALFESLLERRVLGEPVAYILGEREFWSLTLQVNRHVLIPRPETELLVETALSLADESPHRVADLGTGSGAIALALASERAQWDIVATDISADALGVASDNAGRLHLGNVSFHQGAWCEALPEGLFDLLLSNPPYIAPHDVHLQQGDLRFEPASALSAPDSGLADLRTLIAQAPAHLKPGGWLLLEHGYDQGQAVRDLFSDRGYTEVKTLRDFNGVDRVTLGQFAFG